MQIANVVQDVRNFATQANEGPWANKGPFLACQTLGGGGPGARGVGRGEGGWGGRGSSGRGQEAGGVEGPCGTHASGQVIVLVGGCVGW